jgi:hypothetical protein
MSRCFPNFHLKSCFVFFGLLLVIFTANASPEAAMRFSSPSVIISSIGKVLAISRVGGYSFIEMQVVSLDHIFLASSVLPNEIYVSTSIVWENAHLANNYYSHALQRTFTQLIWSHSSWHKLKRALLNPFKR